MRAGNPSRALASGDAWDARGHFERGALERLFEGEQGLVGVREGERATTFSFAREAPVSEGMDTLAEHVSLDTSALPSGDHILAIEVTDLVGGGTTVQIERKLTIGCD